MLKPNLSEARAADHKGNWSLEYAGRCFRSCGNVILTSNNKCLVILARTKMASCGSYNLRCWLERNVLLVGVLHLIELRHKWNNQTIFCIKISVAQWIMWFVALYSFTKWTWEQWYYNSGFQEVVISIHFVKIKTTFLQNSLDSNQHQQVLHRSSVLCSDNCELGNKV